MPADFSNKKASGTGGATFKQHQHFLRIHPFNVYNERKLRVH
jgi:hypothetical protein